MKTIATTILLLASLSRAWSINGHLLVANIAQDLLQENASDSLAAANQLLTYLKEADPEQTYREDQHAFVECATFADDTKYHGEDWQADYHFKDLSNIIEGQESDYDIVNSPRNLTVGLSNIVSWLSGKQGDDYRTSDMYTYLMNKFANDENLAKSFALRLLIHYVGDLVQPFHCENLYSSEFTEGDKGANYFPLKYHYDVDELHALWDKVLYTQHNNIARPFTVETWDTFQPQVATIMDDYAAAVADPAVYETLDFDAMAVESFNIATTLYDGVFENEAVPQEYLDKNIPLANARITIGGYRLYYIIDFIFSQNTKTAEAVKEEASESADRATEFLQ